MKKNIIKNEIVGDRAFLLNTVKKNPPRFWNAQKVKNFVLLGLKISSREIKIQTPKKKPSVLINNQNLI